MKQRILLASVILILSVAAVSGDGTWINRADSPVQFFVETEQGAVSILHHTYRVGETGTLFNFRTQGGQEILYPFERYAVGAEIAERHRVTLTYQPLQLVTRVVFKDPVTIDAVTFAADTPMELSYGFPFYRLTYTYDFLGNDPNIYLGAGAALQLRNASIKFSQLNGEQLSVSQNLGPVPALSIYSRVNLPTGLVLSVDITGLYASSAIINGANFEFEGSILDASLRAGYQLANGAELFGAVRFFGGSAKGTSQYPDTYWSEAEEDYTENYIASVTVSLGTVLR